MAFRLTKNRGVGPDLVCLPCNTSLTAPFRRQPCNSLLQFLDAADGCEGEQMVERSDRLFLGFCPLGNNQARGKQGAPEQIGWRAFTLVLLTQRFDAALDRDRKANPKSEAFG